MSFQKIIFSILMLFLVACGSNAPTCEYGQPEAIFSKEIAQISKHQFEVKGQESLEEIIFNDGRTLEIRQSGCETVKQEFQFRLPKSDAVQQDVYWIEKAIEQTRSLADLGEAYAPFVFWAQAIEAQKETLKLGQSIEVQPGYLVKIDKIASSDFVDLQIILSLKN